MLIRRLLITALNTALILIILSAAVPAWDQCPWSTSSCCNGGVGDINGDGEDGDPVDLSYLVDYLFTNGSPPACADEADLNQDGSAGDPTDLSLLVDHLFSNGPTLPSCP